jgi:hypothetical protein
MPVHLQLQMHAHQAHSATVQRGRNSLCRILIQLMTQAPWQESTALALRLSAVAVGAEPRLLGAPLPWLAELLASMDQPDKQALMGTCYRARQLVLEHTGELGWREQVLKALDAGMLDCDLPAVHAGMLGLLVQQGSNLQALAKLLHMPAGELCFRMLGVSLSEPTQLALLPQISVLRDGRIQLLHLQNVSRDQRHHTCSWATRSLLLLHGTGFVLCRQVWLDVFYRQL